MPHQWKPTDDLIAVLLYKIKASDAAIAKAAHEIGCPEGSLKKRIENVEYLDRGTGGMDHFAKQTEAIYNAFWPII